MKLLSGILAATLTGAVALTCANAADMYPGPGMGGPAYVAINWNSLYAGVNGGYGWSNHNDILDPRWLRRRQIGCNLQRGILWQASRRTCKAPASPIAAAA